MIFNIVLGMWLVIFILSVLFDEYDDNDKCVYSKKEYELKQDRLHELLAILITIMAIASKFI